MKFLKNMFNIAMFILGLVVMYTIFQLLLTFREPLTINGRVSGNAKDDEGKFVTNKKGKMILNPSAEWDIESGEDMNIIFKFKKWTSSGKKKAKKHKIPEPKPVIWKPKQDGSFKKISNFNKIVWEKSINLNNKDLTDWIKDKTKKNKKLIKEKKEKKEKKKKEKDKEKEKKKN